MFFAAFLEHLVLLPLNAKLTLPDVVEFRVTSAEISDDLGPALHMEARVALADLSNDYPSLRLHVVSKGRVGFEG